MILIRRYLILLVSPKSSIPKFERRYHMEIKQYLTTVNYTPSSNKQNKYIVIHYTANNGDTAQGNANYFHSINRNASANYFVDESEIVQVVPDNYIAWHCESKGMVFKCACRNKNSIGIELCSRKDSSGNFYFKDGTVNNSIQLVVYLMNKYNVPIENVIRHFDVVPKLCPQPFIDETAWEKYKSLLGKALKGSNLEDNKEDNKMYQNINEVPEWAKNTINKLINKGCFADVNKLALTDEMVRIFVIMDRWMA